MIENLGISLSLLILIGIGAMFATIVGKSKTVYKLNKTFYEVTYQIHSVRKGGVAK